MHSERLVEGGLDDLPAFEIVLPAGMHDAIRHFLFSDPTREYMGVILAGVCETAKKVKLLGRRFIPVQPDEYEHQSSGGITVQQNYSRRLLKICQNEGLSQIDVHSHPFGPSPDLWFSGTDDAHERLMAEYIYTRLEGSLYASLVMNEGYSRARIWLPYADGVREQDIDTLTLAEFPFRKLTIAGQGYHDNPRSSSVALMEMFARQVLAFGADGQRAMKSIEVVVIGAGGQGSVIVDGLVRLGFQNITVMDPDKAELSNLNRVINMTEADAINGVAKVDIASRNARAVNHQIAVRTVCASVFSTQGIDAIKSADMIVVATDNHATRMFAQRMGAQYLLPVISVGVNIEVDEGTLTDMSGEYAVALPGASGWCLACARVYDPETAAIELADAIERRRWEHRGYITGADVNAPAVYHLNSVVANLALAEIHNLVSPFKEFKSYVAYDMLRGELMPYTIERNSTCAICADKALLAVGDIEPIPDYERSLREPVVVPPPEAYGTA